MKEFISKKGIYIAVAAVVVAIVAAVSVALSGGSGFAALLSEPFFKPVKSVMTSLVSSLERVYGYMYRYDELEAENAQLKTEIAKLEEDYREYTQISEENARLRTLLGFSERHEDIVLEPVSVIAWTASNFSSSFTISKGTSSGLEMGDSVITEEGYLVGQITSVTSTSATVTTVIDTTLSVGALIYETGETGVASGQFDLFPDGLLRLSYIAESGSVLIGDTVVTSGSGGVYPAGLVIGKVVSISVTSSGLDPYAVIAPSADIAGSAHLYVITDFAVSE